MRVRYSFSSRHTGNIANIRKQKSKFPPLVKEVIRISDIVLEVLDARFPEETRNLEAEQSIKKLGKKIIYVLNKSDLVDPAEVQKTLTFYPHVFVSCRKRLGSKILRNMIKIEAKRIDLGSHPKVHVGVIGYPNTGKSSLLNILVGRSSAGTGAMPGFTKGIQKVRLSENILILDTPGVIPESEYSMSKKDMMEKHAIVGARSYATIKQPEMTLAAILEKYPGVVEKYYEIPAVGNVNDLIEQLGKKKGFLQKGGVVDIDRASRFVIKDWQEGKIRV